MKTSVTANICLFQFFNSRFLLLFVTFSFRIRQFANFLRCCFFHCSARMKTPCLCGFNFPSLYVTSVTREWQQTLRVNFSIFGRLWYVFQNPSTPAGRQAFVTVAYILHSQCFWLLATNSNWKIAIANLKFARAQERENNNGSSRPRECAPSSLLTLKRVR